MGREEGMDLERVKKVNMTKTHCTKFLKNKQKMLSYNNIVYHPLSLRHSSEWGVWYLSEMTLILH